MITLTKTDVTLFLVAMSDLLAKALNYNKTVPFLTREAQQPLLPVTEAISICKVCREADTLYQQLFEASEWKPVYTARDHHQVVPQGQLTWGPR